MGSSRHPVRRTAGRLHAGSWLWRPGACAGGAQSRRTRTSPTTIPPMTPTSTSSCTDREPGVTVEEVGDNKTFDDGLPTKTVDCGDQVQGEPGAGCPTLSSVPNTRPPDYHVPRVCRPVRSVVGDLLLVAVARADIWGLLRPGAVGVGGRPQGTTAPPPQSANLVCHIKIAGYVTIEAYWRSGTSICPTTDRVVPRSRPRRSTSTRSWTSPAACPSPAKNEFHGFLAPPSDPLADRVGNGTPDEGGTGPTGKSPGRSWRGR